MGDPSSGFLQTQYALEPFLVTRAFPEPFILTFSFSSLAAAAAAAADGASWDWEPAILEDWRVRIVVVRVDMVGGNKH